MEAIIEERGNGWPHVGHYVPGDDGELYRVVALGPIHTGARPGAANYIYAEVVRADWDDCPDDHEFPALAFVRDSPEED